MSQVPALCTCSSEFQEHLPFELTADPSVTLTSPSMPEGASPVLVWLLGMSPVRL